MPETPRSSRLPFSLRGRRTFTGPRAERLENGDLLLWSRPVPEGAVLVLETWAAGVGHCLLVCRTRRGRLLDIGGVFPRRWRPRAIEAAAALVARAREQRAPRGPAAGEAWLRRELEALDTPHEDRS